MNGRELNKTNCCTTKCVKIFSRRRQLLASLKSGLKRKINGSPRNMVCKSVS